MSPHIESVKSNIQDIVQRIQKTNGNLRLRLALVGYRDLCDEQQFDVLDFVNSVDEFESFLSTLNATGGGDAPEDIAGAIERANKLHWQHPTRVVFLIADAPCHGTEFHMFGPEADSYPTGTPGVDIATELRALANHHESEGTMTIYFGRITEHTDTMIARLKYLDITLEVIGVNDSSELTESVTKGVRTSIFKTMSITGKKSAAAFAHTDDIPLLLQGATRTTNSRYSVRKKDYRITLASPSPSEWWKRPAERVKAYRINDYSSMEDLWTPLREDRILVKSMFMRRATQPFAEGESRIAYFAQVTLNHADVVSDETLMVAKSYKHIGKGLNDRTQYLRQMEVSSVARMLAEAYNVSSDRPSHCGHVHVLDVYVVEEERDAHELEGNRRFCAERSLHMKGTFMRYSNNKGVKSGNDFFLTDPVILCQDILRFGNTNLGGRFIKKCIDATDAIICETGWASLNAVD